MDKYYYKAKATLVNNDTGEISHGEHKIEIEASSIDKAHSILEDLVRQPEAWRYSKGWEKDE